MKKNGDLRLLLLIAMITLSATLATYLMVKIKNGYVRPMRLTYSFIYD